ncbi:MAG: YcbK family protein [Candidatus Binataceae bacterium]
MANKDDNRDSSDRISRRRMIRNAALIVASATFSGMSGGVALAEWIRLASPVRYSPEAQPHSQPNSNDQSARSLSFHNAHTGENLNTVYWENGRYIPDSLHAVNYFFRDFRANQIEPIDPRLLDLLHAIRSHLGSERPFTLISGYRTAATNAWLASRPGGVARHSMHIEGRAADINLPGCDLTSLHHTALAIRGGGVGYYPHSDFVHVDTGRVRHWQFG